MKVAGRSGEHGSTLLLFPSLLLVVVALAAVTVDLAAAHLAQRQADDLAAAIAADGATVGLDESALRSGAGYRLDPTRVARLARSRSRATPHPLLDNLVVSTRLSDPVTVVVTVTARVPVLLSRAVRAASRPITVRSQVAARAVSR